MGRRGKVVKTMKETNILNGWRNPNEDPEIESELLIVFRDNLDNMIFRAVTASDIKQVRNWKRYTLLGWQYFPIWEEE